LIRLRRRGTGEIVNLLDLEKKRPHDVVPDQLEAGMIAQMRDVLFASGEEIVEAEDVVPAFDQAIAQMAAEKPGPSGDKNARHVESALQARGRIGRAGSFHTKPPPGTRNLAAEPKKGNPHLQFRQRGGPTDQAECRRMQTKNARHHEDAGRLDRKV